MTYFYSFLVICYISFFLNFTPPGTVKIDENFFVDKTEIRNIDWREFLYWTKNKYGYNSQEYLIILPDTMSWFELSSTNGRYVSRYFQKPEFANYPVVGVSYEQVLMYCKWRSDRVNEWMYIKNNKLKFNKDSVYDFPEIVRYRLPSPDEWTRIANKGISNKNKKRIEKGKSIEQIFSDSLKTPLPVGSSVENISGISELFGNVAEMTSVEGIAMGGAFIHNKDDWKNAEKTISYTSPKCWLGFRCVCEIIN